MDKILFDYEMNPTTWVYLSSLIMIAVYFKFRRFWSVRNVDLIALGALAPGLLLVVHGQQPGPQPGGLRPELLSQMGYILIFGVGAFFLVRLLVDPLMVRRPLLEPNLSASGLAFAGVAMLVFLISNVVTPQTTTTEREGARWAYKLLSRDDSPEVQKYLARHAPGYPLFYIFSTDSVRTSDEDSQELIQRQALRLVPITRTTATLAHLAVVLAMILIGYRHFDNIQTGMAASTLYLLLPYTADYTPQVDHVVPAALLVWAVQCYRRPALAGMLVGLAGGLIYYPLFLLPLWCSFYWRRGLIRFGVGVAVVLLVLAVLLVFTSADTAGYLTQLRMMFAARLPEQSDLTGFWASHSGAFRYTVCAGFVAMCAGMAIWPAQKNLGTLLSCSAAVMVGAQFWKAHDGGIFMAWYLPLLILTIFRPNLEDRIALSAVSEGWGRRRGSGIRD